MALIDEGNLLVYGGESSTIYIWDLKAGRCKNKIAAHDGNIESLAFDAISSTLISTSDDGSIKTWDVDHGRLIHHVERAHGKGIFTFTLDSRNRMLFTGGLDGWIKAWNVDDLVLENEAFLGSKNGVLSTCMTMEDDHDHNLFAGSVKGKIFRWNMNTGSINRFADSGAGPIFSLKHLANPNILLSGNAKGKIDMWDLDCGEKVSIVQTGQSKVMDILLLRGFSKILGETAKSFVATAGGDGTIKTWRYTSKRHRLELIHSFKGHTKTVEMLLQHPFQDMIFSISSDKSLKSWALE